ncbi:C-X-C chemokine receptor type 5 [Halichoeres trimaculatus]|uniref:C-X-C chemokine receptor type 5 n=1 Tax=Halichoeres trimaculatus TaxID=147232 RepID=UPI003D9DDEE0
MTSYYYDPNMTGFTCYDEEEGLQSTREVFQHVFYSLILLLGVVGNGLMITVLLGRRRHLRITEIYLLHLALADLMLLFTFPFSMVESVTGWLFGEFLCKLIGLMKNLHILCGSFLLACIGFDRYLAIVHAVSSLQNRRQKTVHLTCVTLWVVCFAFTMPDFVFLTVKEDVTNASWLLCLYHNGIHAHNWVLTSRVLGHVCFFLPLAAMSYCYTAVVVTLFKSQKSQAKQGAIRLALVVTFVFCVCWLPYNITLLIQTLVDLQVITYESCRYRVLLEPVLEVTKSLGFSHSCLNPFLYAFIGVRFRNELKQLFYKLTCRTWRYSGPRFSDATTSNSTIHS